MFEITAYRTLLFAAFLLPAGCAIQPSVEVNRRIEVAFSPEAGSEVLVLKVLATAKESIRLSGYTFTSPAVVRGLGPVNTSEAHQRSVRSL